MGNKSKAYYERYATKICRQGRERYHKNKKYKVAVLKRSSRRYKKFRKAILLRAKMLATTVLVKHRKLLTVLRKEAVRKTDPLWRLNYYSAVVYARLCHYCGASLSGGGHNLDCMDCDQKHLCSNVVPCCWECNKIKRRALSYKEMLLLSPALNTIRIQRGI